MRIRPLRQKLRVVEALVVLTVADAAVRVIPFRRIGATLGERQAAGAAEVTAAERERSLAVGRAVRSAARFLPQHPVCLAQAIAAQWMLRRRGIAGTVYLGAQLDTSASTSAAAMKAHAWVRVGGDIVVGRAEHRRYTPVASFAPRPSSAG